MKVLIVGAGIGGLATALFLHDAGIESEIYERSPAIRELGVGINALPLAVAPLAGLGLLDRLDDVAVRTSELFYCHRLGQVVMRRPCGLDAGFDVPQLSVHRGRLQGVLLRAVRERLGPDAVHTGHRFAGLEQNGDGVRATFTDPAGAPLGEREGDVLLGTDGIHSTVRATFFPDEGPPRWNGVMMWRGATDWPPFLTGRSMIVAGGNAAKLVLYPIGRGGSPDTVLTNWAICIRTGEPGDPPLRREDWSRPGDPEELAPHIARSTPRTSTCQAWSRPRRRCTSTRCATATRCRGGATAASPCSATPPTRCTRWAPTARAKPCSTPSPSPAT
jgi:5-methylphenazine-1-carboxylate 1-monooxygenase